MKNEIFSQRVKELRIANNLTQPQLGECIGLSKQAINDIEQGRRETTITRAILLARLFNTTVDYLTGETDDPTRPKELPFVEQLFAREDLFCFSKRLKELRLSKGLSVQEMGKVISSGTLRYQNFEGASTNPLLTCLTDLADYFDVSIDYLVGRTDNPNSHKV